MTDIRELDPGTVERIAAGEVVERPASAVKELVENSLDADADRVEVALAAGGTDRIRVTDDGAGMTESEVRRAVEKHTTSKITDIGDLAGGIATLGFRGEALHAIGAVSRLTITTRPHGDKHDGDAGAERGAHGTELTVEGGEVTGVSPAGCPEGTTVEVRELFYNVPARRKYLKRESTEFAHANTVVTSYALANPDVAVSLSHDGRETFATTGRGDRREAVMAVYGREVAEAMVDVDSEAMPEGPLDGVTGLVSHPETNRASREYLSTFVNGRYVTAAAVRDAVVEAYDTQLAPDRYPFAVLDLSVDPADVDVNVHPRKLEVRFADESGVREQIRTAIEETLLAAGLIRSSAPRGRSAPDQAEIRPDSDGTDADEGSGADADADSDAPEKADATGGTDGGSRMSSAPSRAGSVDADESTTAGSDASGETTAPPGPSDRTMTDAGSAGSGRERSADRVPSRAGNSDAGRKFEPAHEQTRLDGESGGVREFDRLPAMRVLGQFRDTYVVAETADGLVLIDQHAADERVNYERLRESLAGETETQVLAEPLEVSLTAREAEVFEAHADALARLGFRAERIEEGTVAVRTVPAQVADAADADLLREVVASFVEGDRAAAGTVEAAAEDLLADLACYPAITGNTSLTEGSVVDLLAALDECENPYACPHGRPVVVEIDGDELDARFERDYPGHTD